MEIQECSSWIRSLFYHFLFVLSFLSCVQLHHGNIETVRYSNKVLIIIENENIEFVDKVVRRHRLQYERHVLGRVYEYQLENAPEISSSPIDARLFQRIVSEAHDTILNVYQAEEIRIPFEIQEPHKWTRQRFLRRRRSVPEKKLKLFRCSPNYGMHVTDVWFRGYQGHGSVVAIVDTGVEVTHEDLAPNINHRLSRNLVKNQSPENVNPDILTSYMEYDVYSDHGNNCAGLVAAIQDNDVCSCGVAPHAEIAALKVVELIEPDSNSWVLKYKPEWLMKALSHKRDEIHIYSNSYGPREDFAKSASVMNEIFKDGAENGRKGKGSIYVFAAGNNGRTQKNLNLDGYINSIYTITISSVGIRGTIPNFAQPGSVILASTYGEGVNKFDNFLVTTSHQNSCTDDFKRTSASAAMASGIIALALPVNPNLTWRDVQHLIAVTSGLTDLEGQEKVVLNGAGFRYHPYFGFGLMNASALVHRAQTWKSVPPQKHIRASKAEIHRGELNVQSVAVEVCRCPGDSLNFTEHVVAYIEYTSYYDTMVEIELCSPSKTCSPLLTKQTLYQPSKPVKTERKWNFMSLQFWGENPCGLWNLKIWLNEWNIKSPDDRVKVKMFDLTVYGFGTNDDADSTKTVICDDVTSSPKPIDAKSEDNINLQTNDHKYEVDQHVTETAYTSDWDKLKYGLIGLACVVAIVILYRMWVKTSPKSV